MQRYWLNVAVVCEDKNKPNSPVDTKNLWIPDPVWLFHFDMSPFPFYKDVYFRNVQYVMGGEMVFVVDCTISWFLIRFSQHAKVSSAWKLLIMVVERKYRRAFCWISLMANKRVSGRKYAREERDIIRIARWRLLDSFLWWWQLWTFPGSEQSAALAWILAFFFA